MHEMLQEIVNHTAEKFGLDDYYLKRYHTYREKNYLNDTSYLLSMEWFPNKVEETDEDYNPTGTAVIEMNIHTKKLKRVIFVQEVTYAKSVLTTFDMEQIIEWIEGETGLEFGRQFKLVRDENGEVVFQAAVDNVPVFPSGSIQVQFNDLDQLVLFSIDGDFPNETQINWEPFSLTPAATEPIAKDQCKLLEIPIEEDEKWLPVYGATTVFITNDGKDILSFDEVEANSSFVKKNTIMEWDTPLSEPFIPEEIDLSLEVPIEEALTGVPHPDVKPLLLEDMENAIVETRNFLRSQFPEDSGQWKITGIRRENGYIFIDLKPAHADHRVIERKMKLILDEASFKPINLINNNVILDMLKHFTVAEKAVVSSEEAFKKLCTYIEVTPVYVYEPKQDKYILCGKMDCSYGVDAVTGNIISLDDL